MIILNSSSTASTSSIQPVRISTRSASPAAKAVAIVYDAADGVGVHADQVPFGAQNGPDADLSGAAAQLQDRARWQPGSAGSLPTGTAPGPGPRLKDG